MEPWGETGEGDTRATQELLDLAWLMSEFAKASDLATSARLAVGLELGEGGVGFATRHVYLPEWFSADEDGGVVFSAPDDDREKFKIIAWDLKCHALGYSLAKCMDRAQHLHDSLEEAEVFHAVVSLLDEPLIDIDALDAVLASAYQIHLRASQAVDWLHFLQAHEDDLERRDLDGAAVGRVVAKLDELVGAR